MSDITLFIDVNIPMYAAGGEHPYRKACAWALTEIAEGNLEAAIDTEIIQEVFYRFGSLRLWEVAETMSRNLLLLIPEILPITPTDMVDTVDLFSRYGPEGITARDLLHTAVMRNSGLTTILSTDKHFDRIEGIRRIDPINLYQQSLDRNLEE